MRTYLGMNPIGHRRVLKDPLFKHRHMDLLVSFAYKREYELLEDYNNINLMIDSGAFTLNKKPETTLEEMNKYAQKYRKFIFKTRNDPRIKSYLEMDLLNLGEEGIMEIREKLFEVSPNIIPVWHKWYGAKRFMEMCKEYDYIATPCRLGIELTKNSLIHYVNYAHKHNCKIHGLGVTNVKVLDKIPFDTVDSMTWIQSTSFGFYGARRKYINSNYVAQNVEKVNKGTFLQHLAQAEYYHNKWRWYHND